MIDNFIYTDERSSILLPKIDRNRAQILHHRTPQQFANWRHFRFDIRHWRHPLSSSVTAGWFGDARVCLQDQTERDRYGHQWNGTLHVQDSITKHHRAQLDSREHAHYPFDKFEWFCMKFVLMLKLYVSSYLHIIQSKLGKIYYVYTRFSPFLGMPHIKL